MSKTTDLTGSITKLLSDYSDEVYEKTKEIVDDVSKNTLKVIKKHAPIGARKGKYKKSLKVRPLYETLTNKTNVIYAADGEHRLTHLLEHGHATTKGGRTQAQPHFSHGQDFIDENLVKKIKNEIGG